MERRLQGQGTYRALPAKVAQWVVRLLDQHWQSGFTARAAWRDDPAKFLAGPKLPGYKDKQKGRNLLVYTTQALSVPALWQGLIAPSMRGRTVQTKQQKVQQNVQQNRIIPRIGFYVVAVVYERGPIPAAVNPALQAGVDSGLNTLAVLASDKPGFVPRVVNGRPVKSSNPCYNKRRAAWQSQLGAAHGQAHAAD